MTDVIDFLEHFGIKGMQWGVRNKKGSYTPRSKGTSRKPRSEAEKRELVKNLALFSVVTVGVTAVGIMLQRRGDLHMGQATFKAGHKPAVDVKALLNMSREVKLSDLGGMI